MHSTRRNLILGLGAAAVSGAGLCADSVGRRLAASKPPALAQAAPTPQPAPAAPAVLRPTQAQIRRVALHNLHTGDKLAAVYWEDGRYVPDALAEAQRVLRDWRNGEEHFMDPKLFDVMHGISAQLETDAPFQIISGYRSPGTNAMLHDRSAGVATHSQHMEGKASDVRIQGVELANLHKAAKSLRAGGVGYYPVSNFVHIDVARVRSWQGA